MGSGMDSGPSLALLLAGPALSLPNMLVINSVIGPRKTITYVSLVIVMATLTGWIYGLIFNYPKESHYEKNPDSRHWMCQV